MDRRNLVLVRAGEGFELRYTDFVEIMAPCLRRDALARVLPLFNRTKSGFGLSNIWHRLGSDRTYSQSGPVSLPLRDVLRMIRVHLRETPKLSRLTVPAA